MSGFLKTSNYKYIYLGIALTLVIFAALGRWLPHPPNFAPISAIAIFSGAFLPRRYSMIVPLLAIIVTDLVIGLHSTIFYTWGSIALIALISSRYLSSKFSAIKTVTMSLSASFIFYLVTNFGVWAQGKMYALTFSGLVQSYVNAIPFFRNTLLSDMIYTASLFAVFYLSVYIAKSFVKETKLPLVH